MKIVHASNFSLRDNGANYYAMPYKLSNGLTRLGHFVFNYSDRDVANANLFRIRELGAGRANKKLIGVCKEIRPDLLLLGPLHDHHAGNGFGDPRGASRHPHCALELRRAVRGEEPRAAAGAGTFGRYEFRHDGRRGFEAGRRGRRARDFHAEPARQGD